MKVLGQDVWDELSGLEIMEKQIAGELSLPPSCCIIGLELIEADSGVLTMRRGDRMAEQPREPDPGGRDHDARRSCARRAVETMTPPGTALATIDIKVNFLRPVQADGRDLVATGRVEHACRTLAIANAELFDADQRRVAIATGSSMFLPGHPAALGEIELGRDDEQEEATTSRGWTDEGIAVRNQLLSYRVCVAPPAD